MTPTQIQALLREHGLRPSKALGQHFLADTNMAAHIVRLAGVQPGDRVVEVGPGLGSLTLALCEAGASVRAVELDRRLADALATVVEGKPVEIVQADALTVDWPELLADGDHWIMVSNLPYNVATPVLMGALERAPMIDRFLVMVQREVGERLAAVPGTKAYGAVSVKVAYYARAELVGAVPASVFVPKPKVVSALVRMDRREEQAIAVADPERMFELVRAGFSTRRKMLRRVLSAELGPDAEATLRMAGIDPAARAETLQLPEWSALAQTVATGAPPECRLEAGAKLTLSLRVVGTRDDGYHEIDAFVVAVSEPHDEIVLRPAIAPSLSVAGPQGSGVPLGDENLALRAARGLGANVGIELYKGIPMGAGLGGGSVDAAAVLIGAPRLAGIDVDSGDLDRFAASLGADVPFCLAAAGPMRVRGIGDDLARVTLPPFAVVIATPPFGCSTEAVYRAWDTLGGPVGDNVEIDGLPPLRNDLERAAHAVEPRLAAFKVLVEHAAGSPALLAGSGSSYALLFATTAEAEAARARIGEVVEGHIVVGHTIDACVRIVS
ncbi:MAG TPA: 16S rRNA (adenine(1518)-N(6)/adenine(1519)-N(6))-dimethyltransferase RsmA [Acidimicrobiia bacterium]|nr:16S rRNA (adenine(1518)-N(6)/adenine(1519)-N(6))-dimethyltransferase RsmA [Acidimicrobiia bacterium]